jgi:hypothetical protein
MTPEEIAAQITDDIHIANGLTNPTIIARPKFTKPPIHDLDVPQSHHDSNVGNPYSRSMESDSNMIQNMITEEYRKFQQSREYQRVPTRISILPKKLYESAPPRRPAFKARIIPKVPNYNSDIGKRHIEL